MLSKTLSIRLVFLLSFILCSGCASVPDVPVCIDLDQERGYCINTISNKEFYVDQSHLFENKNWQEVKATSLITPSSSWTAIKKYILKQCKNSNSCKDKLEKKSSKLEIQMVNSDKD